MAVKFQDYYETLGVARTASAEEIKLGFRKLARIHHPDVAKDKLVGEAKFKELNEAYEILGEPEKRRRYDELGAAQASGGRAQSSPGEAGFEFGGTGFSDFYESFFGGARGRASARHGLDVEADLLVTLEDALRGSTRKVTLRRRGERGVAERVDTYQVRIPPGVHEGQRIRLAGQGEAGSGGAAAGDLHLRVRLARHPDFTVRESDLYHELDLAPWEAALGAQVKIPSLEGHASLRVPAGTAGGVRLRLRGLGLPGKNGGRGDLFATTRILFPDTLSAEERGLWERLARLSPFQARSDPAAGKQAGPGASGNTP